jgi:Protein of unknown function (DUF3047)
MSPIGILVKRIGCTVAAGWMVGLLTGCAAPSVPAPSREPAQIAELWAPQRLPGKRITEYTPAARAGQHCTQAKANRSASLWRRILRLEPQAWRSLQFSWWVDTLSADATVADVDRDDASARLVLAFDGDASRLSTRNQMLFELAHTLTGEIPPYATLMYVWDASAPIGTIITNGRSDRIRKIVVESGSERLHRWRHYERDAQADFLAAFGEAPGALIGMAFMTDADNTQTQVEACYGPATLR